MSPSALRLVGIDAYYGPAQALFGLDLEVPTGSVTVLLGRNGAGKSTTMKAIMGLVALGQGEIEVGGESTDQWRGFFVESDYTPQVPPTS